MHMFPITLIKYKTLSRKNNFKLKAITNRNEYAQPSHSDGQQERIRAFHSLRKPTGMNTLNARTETANRNKYALSTR